MTPTAPIVCGTARAASILGGGLAWKIIYIMYLYTK